MNRIFYDLLCFCVMNMMDAAAAAAAKENKQVSE